jgi:heme-degrading monooxygenase HmoA
MSRKGSELWRSCQAMQSWYLSEAAEEMHEKPESELLVFQPRF